jgi:uncharacterized protein YdcH (DUF465 family)
MAQPNDRVQHLVQKIDRILGGLNELGKRVKTLEESAENGQELAAIKKHKLRIKISDFIAVCALAISIFALWDSHAKALHISERAYLGVGSISIFCPLCEHPDQVRPPNSFPAEATAFYVVNVLNMGHTPASILDMNFTRHLEFQHRLQGDFDFAEDPRADYGPQYLAPEPNSPFQIRLAARAESILAERAQVPMQRPAGMSGAEYLYIYGHITYKDVFGESHVLLFCREYIGPNNGLPETRSRCLMHESEGDSYVIKKQSLDRRFALPESNAPEPPNNLPPAPKP